MNSLLIGRADFTEAFITLARRGFLLIDDGSLADDFLAAFPDAKLFDPTVHSFNPLKGLDYKRARDFAQILYTASPEGGETLTVRNGKRALSRLLLANTTLDEIASDDPRDIDAIATIEEMLFSPVLTKVVCGKGEPFRFGRKQSIVARINPAELGDYDAFVLALLLIGQHKGQVIVPDGGFYLRPLHSTLIRQERLAIGIQTLAELPPQLRQAVLMIKDKRGKGCTFEDARTLASYEGIMPTGDFFAQYVQGFL